MNRFLRSSTLTLLAALALAGRGNAQTKAPEPQVPRYTIQQFLATVIYGGGSFSPDGRKLLVGSDQTGIFNALAIPVDGGAPVQLTQSKVSAINPIGYFPHDERFLYVSDQGGDEKSHMYVQSPDGSVRDLTPGDQLKANFEGWSRDDRSFFFSTNERDPNAFDLYEMTLDGYQRTLLLKNEERFAIGTVSPDRRWVSLSKTVGFNDVDLYLHDRTTGKTTLLNPGDVAGTEISFKPQTFSLDSKSLFYLTDKGSEFDYLMRYDLATGKSTEVLRLDWDVTGAGFSRDGKYFQATINHDARFELRLFDAATLRPIPLPDLQEGSVNGVFFSRDGSRMAFYAEGTGPADLFVRDMATGQTRQLTRALPQIAPAHLVAGKVVRFKSYDGVEIPGILYKPYGASPDHKVPALVWVHGGPGGESLVGYNGFMQYLLNHGYAVYAINNRGSDGYGKTFNAMDDRKHGEADLDDCVASKKMLGETGWVDPQRIGILGGSYGGFMVLAALAFRPQEFAVGVDLYGVANWQRTLESIPPWWGALRESLYHEMGDPVKDGERLHRISPLFHADQIERPLIVLQGANDPRVLKQESDDIVAALRKKGVPVEYHVFENEGHGFRRKDTQEKGYTATLEFLDKYLKG
ncbi:MAG TPA: S9 family peptidase [Thermoanaerobaculia bacterium]|nr:S9 family peptidase [Thermoanaerobaculia bacterium]